MWSAHRHVWQYVDATGLIHDISVARRAEIHPESPGRLDVANQSSMQWKCTIRLNLGRAHPDGSSARCQMSPEAGLPQLEVVTSLVVDETRNADQSQGTPSQRR